MVSRSTATTVSASTMTFKDTIVSTRPEPRTLAISAARPVIVDTAVALILTVVSLMSVNKSVADTLSSVIVKNKLLATSGSAGTKFNNVAMSPVLTCAVITPEVKSVKSHRSSTLTTSVSSTVMAKLVERSISTDKNAILISSKVPKISITDTPSITVVVQSSIVIRSLALTDSSPKITATSGKVLICSELIAPAIS